MTKTIYDDNRTAGKMCNLTRNGGHTISAAALVASVVEVMEEVWGGLVMVVHDTRYFGSVGGGGAVREIRYTHNDRRRLRHYLTLFRRRRCTIHSSLSSYIYMRIYPYIDISIIYF